MLNASNSTNTTSVVETMTNTQPMLISSQSSIACAVVASESVETKPQMMNPTLIAATTPYNHQSVRGGPWKVSAPLFGVRCGTSSVPLFSLSEAACGPLWSSLIDSAGR